MFLALIAGETESYKQNCNSFYSDDWFINTYDGPRKPYYKCVINGQIENDRVEVTTNTSKNRAPDSEVIMVYYYPCLNVKFIPYSLFDTFVNLEYLYIGSNNSFKTLKREYLRYALKLKNLDIYQNLIEKIDRHVFSAARNLEHINLSENKIESIHKEAFSGLPNLQGVYLEKNKIKNIHSTTFAFITNLKILELSGDEHCINEFFICANQKLPEIEEKILSGCTYEPFPDEVTMRT